MTDDTTSSNQTVLTPRRNRAQNSQTKLTKLNPRQELFCQFYVKNRDLFGNATLAYSIAFGHDLEKCSKRRTKREDGKEKESDYDRQYNVCSAAASQLLRNIKVQARVNELLNSMLTNDVVDAELARIILQNVDLHPKLSAIREYNKLKQRVVEKVDVASGGKPVPILNTLFTNVSNNHRDKKDRRAQKAH